MAKSSIILSKNILLKTIINNYPFVIIYKDKNLNTIYANDLICKYFDIAAPSVIIGSSFKKFLSEENCQIIEKIENNIKRYKKQVECKLNIQKGKSKKIYKAIITPVLKQNKFDGLIYTISDITRKENIKRRLQNNHNQLNALLSHLPLIIYLKDKTRKYILGTKYAKDFIKTGKDTLNNITIDIKRLNKIINTEDKQVLTDKTINNVKETFDMEGGCHYYNVSKIPIKNENNEVDGLITLVNNIDTEYKLASQRETFVATLGHDLKNPTIAQIKAISLLLENKYGDINEEQREILELVLNSCKYMDSMLSSLLHTYKNQHGSIRLIKSNFMFIDLLEECVNEMACLIEQTNVNVFMSNSCINSKIFADRVQMKRVIINLISNGLKYAFKNTLLKIKLYQEDNYICISFKNKSPYIDPEKQKTLFKQYTSFAQEYNKQGIGLGLYASKKITEAHNGELLFESYQDNKNIFYIKIPICHSNNKEESFVTF